jgi:hypothetical protein
LSDVGIVHRLETLMRHRCTALHGLSVAYATEELKKDRLSVPNNVRASAMCIDRSFSQDTANPVFGSQADKMPRDFIHNREKPRDEKFDVASMKSACQYS